MKKLYLLNYVGMGGTEKYVLDLIHATGPANNVFVYSEDGPGLKQFRESGVKIYKVKMSSPFDAKAAFELKKIINKEKVGIVHAQFLRENFIAVLSKLLGANIKVIWTYHVDVSMGLLIRFANKIFTRFNHKVIAVSNFMKNSLIDKGIRKDKIAVVYNGVDFPKKRTSNSAPKEIPNDFRIGIVGRLREEKGHEFLLKSLYKLKNELMQQNWICYVFGEGSLKDKLVKLASDLHLEDRIIFKGFIKNKEEIYENIDLVIVPSLNESLSYVAIEALAYSKPVIATNVGGLPEVIIDGKTGILVEYGDENELANKIKIIMNEKLLYTRLSKDGFAYVKSKFSKTKMIEETQRIYFE